MRKLIILSLMLGSAVIALPSAAEAASTTVAATSGTQIIYQPARNRRGRWNRRTRVVTSTRVRWVGPYRYRETIRTTYFANGTTRTVVVSRVRLTGRRVNY